MYLFWYVCISFGPFISKNCKYVLPYMVQKIIQIWYYLSYVHVNTYIYVRYQISNSILHFCRGFKNQLQKLSIIKSLTKNGILSVLWYINVRGREENEQKKDELWRTIVTNILIPETISFKYLQPDIYTLILIPLLMDLFLSFF